MIKKLLLILSICLLILIGVFAATVLVLYNKQDAIVQELLTKANADFTGRIELRDSHIALFHDFPYISIDLEDFKVFETKNENDSPIINLKEVYVGFDLWTIINGKTEIKKIDLERGRIDLVQYPDGELNLEKAFATQVPVEDTEEEFHLHLKQIEITDVDISKSKPDADLMVDVYISEAATSFKSNPEHIYADLDSKFELSIILDGDTTFIKHKHFEFETELDYSKLNETLVLSPTTAKLEGALFETGGTIDFKDDVYVDLKFSGNKPNFDLFLAVAPPELAPALKKYQNKGQIFFEATIQGNTANGNSPAINARFGCEHAFFNNTEVDKKLDELNFSGFFTNGDARNTSTMEFGIKDFSARPEAGNFRGNLLVKNFDEPEINLQIDSDFDLNFLAKFFGLTELYNLNGKVNLITNFHDIISLEHPEKSIEKLNESYFTQLKIDNLSFNSTDGDVPIKDIDLKAEMNGHQAVIDYCNVQMGNSDIHVSGTVDDLPAIIHHTDQPVLAKLKVTSSMLDLFELTGKDSIASFDEQIRDLAIELHFNARANAFTESPHLPIGEFFIDNFSAQLTHYPHKIQDFHADLFVEEEDFRVIDFSGLLDKSDFHFSGKLKHYDLWFAEHPKGDTHVEFNLKSNMLQLEDIFSYKGENYVPEDYRHEEFDNLILRGSTDLHFNEGLQSIDLKLDQFEAKMKLHALRMEKLKGRIHYEKDHLVIEDFSGKLGNSDIKTTLHYYLGDDESQKIRENKFELTSNRLDFDQLFMYQLGAASTIAQPEQQMATGSAMAAHDQGFNIYALPFSHMTFDVKIGHLNYHKYLIHEIDAALRITPDHYLHVDKLNLHAADGDWKIEGYFNGSDPEHIYFSPDMEVDHVDLDKLMMKFDNFGQDYLVSENLHGKLSGHITGKLRMHKDLMPIVNESEIHLDLSVTEGRLDNFSMLESMSDYFADKNLKRVAFDTLSNHMDFTSGILTIPNMTINSSIGFMDIKGSQDMDLNMDYYLRIPWKMVTNVAASKLFGKKAEEVDPNQSDAIQYADSDKKTRYVNVRIKGNIDDYKITLERAKGEGRRAKG